MKFHQKVSGDLRCSERLGDRSQQEIRRRGPPKNPVTPELPRLQCYLLLHLKDILLMSGRDLVLVRMSTLFNQKKDNADEKGKEKKEEPRGEALLSFVNTVRYLFCFSTGRQ